MNAVYNFKWENSQDHHEFKQYNECAITTDFFDIKKLCNHSHGETLRGTCPSLEKPRCIFVCDTHPKGVKMTYQQSYTLVHFFASKFLATK